MMYKKVVIAIALSASVVYLWPSHKTDSVSPTDESQALSASLLEPRQVRARLRPGFVENKDAPSEVARRFKELVEASSAAGSGSEAPATAEKAFNLLSQAAKNNDKSLLDEIGKLDPNCAFCDEFYKRSRQQLTSSELRSDERAIFASALARSGRSDNISQVVDLMESAGQHPELQDSPSVYANALDETTLEAPVIDDISEGLNSENRYYREAIVSLLTQQGTKDAAERLYQHITEQGVKDGYYNSGMGIGKMYPQPDAIPYLEELARQRDQYSRLAIDALLNSGREGLDRVIALLGDSKDYQSDKSLLKNAVDHISRDPETLAYLKTLSKTAKQQAMREVAQQVLAEKQIDLDNLEKENEYNSNFEQYIIRNPGPRG